MHVIRAAAGPVLSCWSVGLRVLGAHVIVTEVLVSVRGERNRIWIWNRHPARVHVRSRSHLTFARHPTIQSPVPISNLPKLSAIGFAVLEIWKQPLYVCTCSSTPAVPHGNTLPGGCLHACWVSAHIGSVITEILYLSQNRHPLILPRGSVARAFGITHMHREKSNTW